MFSLPSRLKYSLFHRERYFRIAIKTQPHKGKILWKIIKFIQGMENGNFVQCFVYREATLMKGVEGRRMIGRQ